MIDYSFIIKYLENSGYNVKQFTFMESDALRVLLKVDGKEIELIHLFIDELTNVPEFMIINPRELGRLAHLHIGKIHNQEAGIFCVNTPDSLSINFDYPELLFKEALTRYEKLLTDLITNKDFNELEMLREFQAHWLNVCSESHQKIICTSETGEFEVVEVFMPSANHGVASYYIANSKKSMAPIVFEQESESIKQNTKSQRGYILPLKKLLPAPWIVEGLPNYYLSCLSQLVEGSEQQFQSKFSYRSNEFWLIFNAIVPSGRTWFCINLKLKDRKAKKSLPTSERDLANWTISAVTVLPFNKEFLMPRSGAEVSISDKKILLVGAGSVGSEIAEKLAVSGVGSLDLIDPDVFTINNLYRHTLDLNALNLPKVLALRLKLFAKNPWLITNNYPMQTRLLDVRDKSWFENLKSFDLIIIAIGNPTHERLFARFIKDKNINVPIINTWVEGYGVGGHATLDIPDSKGCLYCAYINSSGVNDLNSNLNFLKTNQDLTKNHGGCGDAFLPYSGLAASQTSLIAVDLALKYLLGEIVESSKISWKGSDVKARQEGLQLTDRYYLFKESLTPLSLHNELCDFCNDN